jgi:hypothetical protein
VAAILPPPTNPRRLRLLSDWSSIGKRAHVRIQNRELSEEELMNRGGRTEMEPRSQALLILSFIDRLVSSWGGAWKRWRWRSSRWRQERERGTRCASNLKLFLSHCHVGHCDVYCTSRTLAPGTQVFSLKMKTNL